jgi:GMP synthase (glutamine-hydrolysing)
MKQAKKTAVAVRHLAFEDMGCFEAAFEQSDFEIRYHDIGTRPLTELMTAPPELLVVLGGPIGAYEEDRYPFLSEELRVLKQRLEQNMPTMGICLGAQLMARALGEEVYPGPAKEIGFAPIALTVAGEASCLRYFSDFPVLHWHGDTFDLPAGATLLASTEICENQAFSYGNSAIAFQFHPEAGSRGFERWLIGHTMELSQAGISINELRSEHERLEKQLAHRAYLCAREWLSKLH